MAGGSQGQVRAWALALDLVYGVVAGFVVGYVLDRYVFHTSPWLTMGLSMAMLVGGMVRFVKGANRLNRGFAQDAREGRLGTSETWDASGDADGAEGDEDEAERRV